MQIRQSSLDVPSGISKNTRILSWWVDLKTLSLCVWSVVDYTVAAHFLHVISIFITISCAKPIVTAIVSKSIGNAPTELLYFRCNLVCSIHWRMQGPVRRTPPKGPDSFVSHKNFLKRNCLGSRRLPTRSTPPTGNLGSATGGITCSALKRSWFPNEEILEAVPAFICTSEWPLLFLAKLLSINTWISSLSPSKSLYFFVRGRDAKISEPDKTD